MPFDEPRVTPLVLTLPTCCDRVTQTLGVLLSCALASVEALQVLTSFRVDAYILMHAYTHAHHFVSMPIYSCTHAHAHT
jgi:hypothetical protein